MGDAGTAAAASGGSRVWIPSAKDVWVSAVVERETGQSIFARPEAGGALEEYALSDVHPFDPSHALDLDDVSRINNLHEGPLLDCLRRRFNKDVIYTNVGNVLISINPYKRIPLLYDIDLNLMVKEYRDEAEEEHDVEYAPRRSDAPELKRLAVERPHVYSVADRAFQYLTGFSENALAEKHHVNQSIIISGESGAGKTEASKHVMRYLIAAGQAYTGELKATKDGAAEGAALDAAMNDEGARHIEAMLLESNVILEAFGNAKTMRNDNSSRFGKYIRMLYSADCHLVGAETEHFLLERSRLLNVEEGERNYHIFYQLLEGLQEEELSRYGLEEGTEAFRMCAMGGQLRASEAVDDAKEFSDTRNALRQLGVSEAELACIYKLLASMLHIGNLDFQESEVLQDGSVLPCEILDGIYNVDQIAELLGVVSSNFRAALCKRVITSGRGSMSVKSLTRAECLHNAGGLVKHLYSHLFGWLIRKINHEHGVKGSAASAKFIGILDIFGFEIMRHNSFEQLCINFTNEALQQQFNQHVFVAEQAHYAAEGIDTDVVKYRDNQAVIDLIAGRHGLLPLLENQAKLNTLASDMKFVRSSQKEFKDHPCYKKPRSDDAAFTVTHFAGEVYYDANGFLDKNNDSLQGDMVELFNVQSTPFIGNVLGIRPAVLADPSEPGYLPRDEEVTSRSSFEEDFMPLPAAPPRHRRPARLPPRPGAPEKRGGSRLAGTATISNKFRNQVRQLCDTLTATEPHYIKTIKPNSIKAPGALSSQLVVTQLRYSGVLEVVRIRREGYPSRMRYVDFYRKYEILARKASAKPAKSAAQCHADGDVEAAKAACLSIARCIFGDDDEAASFQMGHSLFFMRDNGLDRMDAAVRELYAGKATLIASVARCYLARKRYLKKRSALQRLQATVRMTIARRHYRSMRTAARKIQELALSRQRREHFVRVKRATVVLQALCRQVRAKNRFSRRAREEKGAVQLQRLARGALARAAAREKRRAYGEAQTTIAKCIRKRRAVQNFQRSVQCITALQTCARGFLARRRYATAITLDRLRRERERKMATLLQSVVRMAKQRKEFQKHRGAATRLAGAWRGTVQRREYRRTLAAFVRLQAVARRIRQRARFLRRKACAVAMQKTARRYLCVSRWRRTRAAAVRLQVAVRAFLANLLLSRKLARLFAAADAGSAGEVESILSELPYLRRVLQRSRGFRSLLHAAAGSGDEGLCHLLAPTASEALARDVANRETPLHCAASSGSLPALHSLLDVFEGEMHSTSGDAEEKKDEQTAEALSPRRFKSHSSSRAHAFKDGEERRRKSAVAHEERLNRSIAAAKALSGESDDSWVPLSSSGGAARHAHAHAHGKARHDRFSHVFHAKGVASSLQALMGMGSAEAAVAGASAAAYGDEEVLKDGYLRKRRETDRFQKRWCVLTPSALHYFHRRGDAKPAKTIQLAGGMLKKSSGVTHTFEIHSPLLLDRRNKEGRLYFQAHSEIELQAWLAPLRVVLSQGASIATRKGPMLCVNMRMRSRAINMRDSQGRTCLHRAVACERDAAEALESFTSRIVQVSCWLVENGCDPNRPARNGKTALHMAIDAKNVQTAAALAFKGAALESADASGTRAIDAVAEEDLNTIMVRCLRVAEHQQQPLLAPPVHVANCTYVSLYMARCMMAETSGLSEPHLAVSVRDVKGEHVESVQDVYGYAVMRDDYVYWGQSWHMQTAIENLGANGKGTHVVIELKDATADAAHGDGAGKRTLSWASLEMEESTIDTRRNVQLEFFEGSYDDMLRAKKRTQKAGNADALPSADVFLQVDVTVQKLTEEAFLTETSLL